MLLLITIKTASNNPEHPAAFRCRHGRYLNTEHCAEMVCANYIMKCQRHGYSDKDKKCSRSKMTAPCPLTNATCTDQTGAHHTGLYAEYESIDAAEIDFKNLGYHITRIEEAVLPDGYEIVRVSPAMNGRCEESSWRSGLGSHQPYGPAGYNCCLLSGDHEEHVDDFGNVWKVKGKILRHDTAMRDEARAKIDNQ